MSDERKFWATFSSRMDKITKQTSSNHENWQPRYEALEDLERILQSGANLHGFKKKMMDYQNPLAEGMALQLTDLRSEIVRQAAVTINCLVEQMGNSFKRFSRKLMRPAIDTAGSGNGTIRSYARKVVPCLLEHTHSKSILMCVLNSLNDSKSNTIRENCMDYVAAILTYWNPQQEISSNIKAIQAGITFGLKCPTTAARTSASKCFWLFTSKFPDMEPAFLSSLDTRARRIVEKSKASFEDEVKRASSLARKPASARSHASTSSHGSHATPRVKIGDRVRVGNDEKQVGVVKFIGEIKGKSGEWAGIEADAAAEGYGNGTIGGKRYFECQPDHGIFSRLSDLRHEGPPVPSRQPTVADDESDDDSVSTPAFQSPRVSDSGTPARSPVAVQSRLTPARKLTDSLLTPVEPPSPTFPSEKPTPTSAKRASLQASAVQKKIDSSPAAVTKSKPKAGHKRELSVVTSEEKERLVASARDHLTSMGAAFQKEMDLWELGHDHPDYISSMIKLMDEVVSGASDLKSQLAAIQRHKSQEAYLEDDFLQSMDNF